MADVLDLSADPPYSIRAKDMATRFEKPYTYTFQDGDHDNIVLQQGAGLGMSVWDCGVMMAKYLELQPTEFFEGKTFVELGSGTGVLGLVCAALGGTVIVSDKDDEKPIIDLLKGNLERNPVGDIRYMPLTWGVEEHADALLESVGHIDYILATDVIYCNEIVMPLVQTLKKICSKEAKVFLGYEYHHFQSISTFFKEIRKWGFKNTMLEPNPAYVLGGIKLGLLERKEEDEAFFIDSSKT